jgi:hypothetical protein
LKQCADSIPSFRCTELRNIMMQFTVHAVSHTSYNVYLIWAVDNVTLHARCKQFNSARSCTARLHAWRCRRRPSSHIDAARWQWTIQFCTPAKHANSCTAVTARLLAGRRPPPGRPSSHFDAAITAWTIRCCTQLHGQGVAGRRQFNIYGVGV